MDDADANKILSAFDEAGYPLDVFQRPDGKWEVTIRLGDSPTTLFANANTRDAAIQHASRTIFPTVLLAVIANAWETRWPKGAPRGVLFAGSSSLSTVERTQAQHFGGFGVILRFHQEPDGAYSWGVFDEKTGEGLSAGVADAFEDAKLDALLGLLPPSGEP